MIRSLSARLLLVMALLISLSACSGRDQSLVADIVLLNGGIYTVDDERRWVEAVALVDGEIIAVGSNESIAVFVTDATEVIDLDGGMALPGLHDAHTHPLEGGYLLASCDLSEVTESVEAVLEFIRRCVASNDDEWVVVLGLDLSLFGINGPDKSMLDEIAPDRLFWIEAADGHSITVNQRVLDLAGITSETPDPPEGVIERRDGSNEPNGTLRESAQEIVAALRPERHLDESIVTMRVAIEATNAVGVTSLIDAWAGELELQTYQAIERSGNLSVRIVNSIIDEGVFEKHVGEDLERVLAARDDYASDLINNDSIKIMVDGVLEGETAALVDEYLGLGHKGVLNHASDDLNARVARYVGMGLQVHMHTIGDGAARAGLDAIEYASEVHADNPLASDLRHHLSHLQLVHPDDIARFAELGVTANFTGAWAYLSDWVLGLNLPVIGQERVDRMYPIKSIIEAGGTVVGGSDWIYGPLNPLDSMEVMITRQDPNDTSAPVGNIRDSIDLATAIDVFTINPAWLMHHEDKVGSIEVGKRADIAVLDKNLFEIPATSINEASVLVTIFDGRVVYRKPEAN